MALNKIEKVLSSEVLLESLIYIPDRGATDAEIAACEASIGRPLSSRHKRLLRRWNGMNIDVIRVFGCGQSGSVIRNLSDSQLPSSEDTVFGDDPAGFIYCESSDGRIYCHDSDPAQQRFVASDMQSFFTEYLFGSGAMEFGGDEWVAELTEAGIL